MEQSLSWEANSSLACQKILCILWNFKIYYWIYKISPTKIMFDARSVWKQNIMATPKYVGISNLSVIEWAYRHEVNFWHLAQC
jgi:hypothetical protein